ncbi:MAG: CDP-alcohol phosphatidyltransferase family protein [Deltaproteobacteria bacterium]|nr:MAG: CDP-alcohol phosphatidyltransferase family protein [Deltaproteobacteria bacterium]
MTEPIWILFWPLIAFNSFLLMTVIFFRLTYKVQPKNSDVDLKEHSRFLNRFFKEYWYWLTSPFIKLMIRIKISPNALTVWGFVISCLAAYFFYQGHIAAGGWTMIFGATFDMFDGHIARLTGRETRSGAFFDSVMDRFCEGVILLGLAAYYRDSWLLYMVVLALIGSMMVSYTRARGEGVGVDVKEGFMQRPERIVYLGVGSVFSPVFSFLLSSFVILPPHFLNSGAIILIAIMTNITALQRMFLVMKRLEA